MGSCMSKHVVADIPYNTQTMYENPSENTNTMYENPSENTNNMYENTSDCYQKMYDRKLEKYQYMLNDYDKKLKEMMEKYNEINNELVESRNLALTYLDLIILLKHQLDTARMASAKTTKTLTHQNKVLQTHIQRIHPNTV